MSTSIQLVVKSTGVFTPVTFSIPPIVSPGATSNALGLPAPSTGSLIWPSWKRFTRKRATSRPLRLWAETSIMSTLVGMATGLDQSLQAEVMSRPPVVRSAGRYGALFISGLAPTLVSNMGFLMTARRR